MSALAAKVSAEHQAVGIVGGCSCGDYPTGTISADRHRTRHLIAVTEAATRAAVAAELAPQVADLIASGIDGASANLDLDIDDAERAVRLADHWRAHHPVDLGRITAALIEGKQP